MAKEFPQDEALRLLQDVFTSVPQGDLQNAARPSYGELKGYILAYIPKEVESEEPVTDEDKV